MRLLILLLILISFMFWVIYVVNLLSGNKKPGVIGYVNLGLFALIITASLSFVGFMMIKNIIIPFIMWLWSVKI